MKFFLALLAALCLSLPAVAHECHGDSCPVPKQEESVKPHHHRPVVAVVKGTAKAVHKARVRWHMSIFHHADK